MADYTVQPWVDDDGSGTVGTTFTKSRMDHIEAGILDAAKHIKWDTAANLPGAAAANKNWLYFVKDTGQALFSDGSAWHDVSALPVGYQSGIKIYSHASIAAGAQQTGAILDGGSAATFGKRVQVTHVHTDHPMRIRCYTTTAKRDADTGRAIGTDPASGTDHGLLLEVVTATGKLDFDLSPTVELYSMASPRVATIPITVDNLDVASQIPAVYLDYQVIEL